MRAVATDQLKGFMYSTILFYSFVSAAKCILALVLQINRMEQFVFCCQRLDVWVTGHTYSGSVGHSLVSVNDQLPALVY